MKKRFFTILLVILFLVGLSVMLYPTVSNWWNERKQTSVIGLYDEAVQNIDDSTRQMILARARAYNAELAKVEAPFSNPDAVEGYEDTLDVTGTGVMGYVTIPKISVNLPIYHGTSAEVMNVAVGHLQGSSLPVGGETTLAVISAHRGLPSARLFSDLDQLAEGDTFTITVLGEILTYEIDQIAIVLPNQLDKLAIEEGKDYVTLVTCTPYGINTHRLLVRGHRIDTVYPHNISVSADAVQIDTMTVVPFIAVPLFVLLLVKWMFDGRKRKRKRLTKEDLWDEK